MNQNLKSNSNPDHRSSELSEGLLPNGAPACRLIAWEVTRSCNLACRHCRAEARTEPYEGELSTSEALNLIDTFPQVGNPIIIFTGGDPMMRKDVYELVAHAKSKGLVCAFSPNGTLITPENAKKLKECGVDRCSISIDAATADAHDYFRGMPNAFNDAMRGIKYLKEAGVPFQINTTVTRHNLEHFREIYKLCEDIGAQAWHIFLLVPTGRGADLENQMISAREYEKVLRWFYDFRKTAKMELKATCAPHYYRIMRQAANAENLPVIPKYFGMDAFSRGCLGGTGFCFISHLGQVQPCGYLPLNCGNVREQEFPQIWKHSKIFQDLRTPQAYKGKCGICTYHQVCGGCRARAYSMKGDYLAEEPLCLYQPPKISSRDR